MGFSCTSRLSVLHLEKAAMVTENLTLVKEGSDIKLWWMKQCNLWEI